MEGRASRPNPFHFPFSFDARHFERYRRYESEEFRFGKKKTILVYWTATIDPLELAKKKTWKPHSTTHQHSIIVFFLKKMNSINRLTLSHCSVDEEPTRCRFDFVAGGGGGGRGGTGCSDFC